MAFIIIIITGDFIDIFFLIFWSHSIDSNCNGVVTSVFLVKLAIGTFLLIRADVAFYAFLWLSKKIG